MDIKGKAAVVTGASSDEGIGSECAKILASRGCNVVVNYASNKEGGEAIVAACKAAGVDAVAVQGDVSKDADCKRLVQAAIDKWGRLDVLINNAATTKPIPHRRMDLLDGDEFLRIYAVNRDRHLSDDARRGAASQGRPAMPRSSTSRRSARCARADRRWPTRRRRRRSTISRSRPRGRWRPRCGSTRSARAACSARWTRKILNEEQYQERLKEASTRYPLKRGIWPYDVAVAALFLVEGATTMTGECIRMDCGQHLGETSTEQAAGAARGA